MRRLEVECVCLEKIIEPCPLKICDGTGKVVTLDRDDIKEEVCPHMKEMGGDEHLQDS